MHENVGPTGGKIATTKTICATLWLVHYLRQKRENSTLLLSSTNFVNRKDLTSGCLEAQYLGWHCVCVTGHVRSGQTACQQPFTQLKACNIQPVHTSATPTKTIKPCCSPSCLQLSSFRAVKLKGSDETERPSNNIGCQGGGEK